MCSIDHLAFRVALYAYTTISMTGTVYKLATDAVIILLFVLVWVVELCNDSMRLSLDAIDNCNMPIFNTCDTFHIPR